MNHQHFVGTTGEEIFLNLSQEHRLADGSSQIPRKGLAAIEVMRSLPPSQPALADHLIAADTIYDEAICISPIAIFSPPLHWKICSHANNISEFVWSLREALDDVGAFSFVEKVQNRAFYEATIERILAVFSLSATGLSHYSQAPLDFVHAVVDFFRSSDGCGWNREILGAGDITVQCASNIIRGLSKVYGDGALLDKARKHRKPSAGKIVNWHLFSYSKSQLDGELLEYYDEHIKGSGVQPGSVQSALLNLSAWLTDDVVFESLQDATSTNDRPSTFSDFLKRRSGGEMSRSLLTIMEAARKVSVTITEQLVSVHQGLAFFDLVTSKELLRARSEVKKLPKPNTTRSRPLPEKMIPIMREILEEGEDGWPGKSGRFVATISHGSNISSIYCPVIPTLFLVMLEVPLRMAQIRRLDSGEGDNVHFNADRMEWEPNASPLAGYWESAIGEGIDSSDTRGYAREVKDELKSITALNVNTNKTGSPHVIPWYLPRVLKLLWDLRRWQEQYNPIEHPIGPEVYYDDIEKISDTTKADLPDIFPIIRLLPSLYNPSIGRVPSQSEINHAWGWLLAEIERRWNHRHPGNQVTLVDVHPKSKQPWRHRYNIHGFRVRGLTNLRRGGMPLDLLSKFVAGHATLRMTLYYTDPEPFEISEAIERAVANSEKQRDFIDELKKLDLEEARRRTVSLSSTAVSEAINSGSQVQFCNVSIGICPFDGTRCEDGGEILRKDESAGVSKTIYGPVAPRNCVMCRHFLSGPPWLEELDAYGTKLCERRQFLAREERRIEGLLATYEDELKAGNISKGFFENKYDNLQAEIIQVKNDGEVTENGIFNIELITNASKQLLDNAVLRGVTE